MASRAPAEKEKLEALAQMDLVRILRAYILAVVSAAQGYKALLVDKETMRIASTLLGRTELGEHGIVLVERLETTGKDHHELKAMCFIRPTRENMTLLKKELRSPRFQSYSLYFTNLVSPVHLQELAEADAVKELVQEVQEYYGDFVAIDPHHFTIPCPRNELFIGQRSGQPSQEFQRGSDHTQRLADSLYQLTYKQQYSIFDFGARSNPIVLILDRKDDPVTPLLTQWTYQAMLHEMMGLNDGTVTLKNVEKDADPAAREMVLDPAQDEFYRKHIFANYGDVAVDVKALMDQFQTKTEKHKQVESLDDMKRFIAEHLDFTKLQGNVTKHVNIMSEIKEIIQTRNLLDVSSAEQELANPATNLSAAASYEEVMRLLRMPGIEDKDKIRLAMLYCLRFEGDMLKLQQISEFLSTAGIKDKNPKLFSCVEAVLQYAGNSKRAGDLYASRTIMGRAMTMFKGMQDVKNVYTQHTPLLTSTLSMLSQDKLDLVAYPYMAGNQEEAMTYQAAFKHSPPREAIVFIIGGSTYEESKCVHDWNERNPHLRVLLGGSAVLNSNSFLTALSGGTDIDDDLT
ncbi:hypothetical protein CEUSTIGMA_g1034.t1 [Chlamydomonas eustigma]|uniref:Uncharacterized protein n=1 Tax=Chlamydomonas eustigma TaxID=1157962 RepID=A0A250WRZ6_9CHLO|nr:hypothetical protein CEUSTIGMA_g1034.t1 [Chlamydomonas eustigma]|eukprot:GAX73583.1 hypothetical protein CEUSTIGMA_g1034.t1 [Chlamydomonas eustigma]